jgi:hypothetical protein
VAVRLVRSVCRIGGGERLRTRQPVGVRRARVAVLRSRRRRLVDVGRLSGVEVEEERTRRPRDVLIRVFPANVAFVDRLIVSGR